ncbi:hypothetical protein TRVA0_014S01486 [Trichomonascus vanleenenianus]|uniref:CCDC174 family protein n=1 Tax=Trichomonascus vanleenenianus TaxID=2268995 RepID=UPI003ECA09E9
MEDGSIKGVSQKTANDLSAEVELAKRRLAAEKASRGGLKTASRAGKARNFLQQHGKRKEEDDEEAARIKLLEEKAKIYEKARKGHFESEIDKDGFAGLIIPTYSSESEDEIERIGNGESEGEVEVEDEFGRTRMVLKSKARAYLHRDENGRDKEANLIHGDVIQHKAFALNQQLAEKIRQEGTSKGSDVHYDDRWEIRDKGVGFYRFSQDKDTRQAQMESLLSMRRETLGQESKFRELKDKRMNRRNRRLAAIMKLRESTTKRLQRLQRLDH